MRWTGRTGALEGDALKEKRASNEKRISHENEKNGFKEKHASNEQDGLNGKDRLTTPPTLEGKRLAIMGLGYVGIEILAAFGAQYMTIGYDIDASRIEELKGGFDRTRTLSPSSLERLANVTFSTDADDLKKADIYILALPTPLTREGAPDLSYLIDASKALAPHLDAGNLVIYESTTYPFATEEIFSQHIGRSDVYLAYSPERINPSDREHSFANIDKVVASDTKEGLELASALYKSVLKASVIRSDSIATAELAKLVENTQRDVNIALMNEIGRVCDALGLSFDAMHKLASTKWNFAPYRLGLVGGHCIPVDPIYLEYVARSASVHTELISTARRVNNAELDFILDSFITKLASHLSGQRLSLSLALAYLNKEHKGANILQFGLSFKENCNDLRNSLNIELYRRLGELLPHLYIYAFDSMLESSVLKGLGALEGPKAVCDKRYLACIYALHHKGSRDILDALDIATIYDAKANAISHDG